MKPVSQVTWGRLLELTRTVRDSPERRELLAELAAGFRTPVLAVLRSIHGLSEEEASSAADTFFAALGERESLEEVASGGGSFRRFLSALLAERPGAPADRRAEADAVFHREWTRRVVSLSLEQMHATLSRAGRAQDFEAFWIHEVEMAGRADRSVAGTAARLGLAEDEADGVLSAARQEWRSATRVVVLGTLSSPDAIDTEMESLFGTASSVDDATQRIGESTSPPTGAARH